MSFISYAQNFEDVLLWRALGHIKNGFYIDVGANDPQEHSVTKAFYDCGWYGVNIEPLPRFQQAFQNQRPRDINLAVAAGASAAEITLFDVPAVNGWASNDEAVANIHKAEGFDVIELTVPQRTLNAICEEHVTREIHFLKIDVEGFEAEVLRGMDFAKWRPWILVIEATLPNSRVTNHETWEHLVTAHDYHFAYFDGLNRYYVAGEHIELRAHLSLQANVFDDFITTHLDKAWKDASEARELVQKVSLEAHELAHKVSREAHELAQKVTEDAYQRVIKAHEQICALDAQLQEARARTQHVEERLYASQQSLHEASIKQQALEGQLHAVYASRSWKLTRPLRWLGRTIISFKTKRWARPLAWVVKKVMASESKSSAPASVEVIPERLEHAPESKNLTISARKALHDLTSRATSAK